MSKKPLTIGIIQQSPDMGGAETYMLSLLEAFLRENHKIIFVSNREKFLSAAKKYPITTYEVPIMLDIIGNYKGLVKSIVFLPYAMKTYAKIFQLLKKHQVSVILMSGFSEKMLCTFLSVFFKIPVVWIEYGPLQTITKRNFFLPRLVYMLLDSIPKRVIVPTKNTYNSLHKIVPEEKLIIIPCGTAITSKEQAKNPKAVFRLTGKFVIGNLSRIAQEKGQETIMYALPHILKKIPHAHVLLCGTGPDKGRLEQLAITLGIANHVTFLGFIPEKETFYQAIDVFVFPTMWELEGFGLVMVEAMMQRVPVIASAYGPVMDIITDKKTGFLFPPGDAGALADTVIKWYTHPQKDIVEAAYRHARTHYNIGHVSTLVLEELYAATNN